MASVQQGRATLAFLGVVAATAIAVYGVNRWHSPEATLARPDPARAPTQAAPQQQAVQPQTTPAPPQQQAAAQPEAPVPSFDVVRVEPNGESVIAGRGVAGATIEMLRDGVVHARAAADQSGLFAFVPPALPPGSHQVTLQSIAPDGTRQRSRESVTIIIGEGRNTRPLVALTAPDKPTVLLSNPEIPEQKSAEAQARPAPSSQPPSQPQQPAQQQQAAAQPPAGQGAKPPPAAPAAPAPGPNHRAEVKIVTVDAEQGGRLFVSGQGTPGASVRLYLNDTFIAPGHVGGDGKVSFAIGRGVRPGDYQVRIDDVDPVSGSVKSRAEVAFNVPSPAATQPAGPAVASAPPAAVGAGPTARRAEPPAPAPGGSPQAETATAGAPPRPSTSNQVASATPDTALRAGTIVIPDVNTAIVSRGDNLWRISQRIYGSGYRYTVIYGANQKQIRDPNMIYPGQVFVLPGDTPPTQQ